MVNSSIMKRIAVVCIEIEDPEVDEDLLNQWLDHLTDNVIGPGMGAIWLEGISYPSPAHTNN